MTLANDPAQPVEYNRDIRPILASKCFTCHGFDSAAREADLRLDLADVSRAVINPGKPDLSELIARIESDDPDSVMPPPDLAKPITDAERKLLRRWIKQGAEYQAHWVYEPIRRPASIENSAADSDAVGDKARMIDTFIDRQLKRRGITPAPQASSRDLVRRLSFDLRGVPPSIEELDRFESDPSEQNYRRLVDDWLASIEHAENEALRWLDLVRYADTSGLVSDEPIATGLYRKYVVESFHRNQPFDQFSTEQLAGDLMEAPSDQQLIASAYNRLVKTNCEAGAIDREQLYAIKGEHVRALGAVWLAATTGCAECHDHKFDPISAKDYYSLAAFFDDLDEVGVYTPGDRRKPVHYVHNDSVNRNRDRKLSRRIAAIQKSIAATPVDPDQMKQWQQRVAAKLKDTSTAEDFAWIRAATTTARIHSGDFTLETIDGRTARVTESDSDWPVHEDAELMTGDIKASAVGRVDGRASLFADVWIDTENPPDTIAIQISSGRYGRIGWKPTEFRTFYWGKKDSLSGVSARLDPAQKNTHVGPIPEPSDAESNRWVRLRIDCDDLAMRFELVGARRLHSPGRMAWGDLGFETNDATTTRMRLAETLLRHWWNRSYYRMTYEKRMNLVADAVKGNVSTDAKLQNQMMTLAFQESTAADQTAELQKIESDLSRIRADATEVLVSKTAAPKITQLLSRGNFMDESGPIMKPAIPEFLGELEASGAVPTRLDLARWLFSDDNPITARVYVNRAWQRFFGRGISQSLIDNGVQGAWPTHPELLDYLAAEFRDGGWDRRSISRMIVLTRAYRRSAMPRPDITQADPNNQTFAIQNRFRLSGEQIRDTALAAAGLLKPTDTVPAESFFPYQPETYWQRSSKIMYGSRHMPWRTSQGDSQYWRTVYGFWKRQNIHPTFLSLDAPTRAECTAKRIETNTPGQALAMLNDTIFVDAAIGLACRATKVDNKDANLTSRQIVDAMFMHTLQRRPSEAEFATLDHIVTQQRKYYGGNSADAIKLVTTGHALGQYMTADLTEEASAELASWTITARVILNLHEFVVRN